MEDSPHVSDKAYALAWGSSRITALAHHLFLPGRRLDVYCQPISACGKQEFPSNCALQERALLPAQTE
jgi:hypothetical protein